jgi:peptidoglycan hydrolase-like protein with peptidoglycan-binding domain
MLAFGSISPSGRCERTVYRAEAIAAGANIGTYNPATATSIPLGALEPEFDVSTAIGAFSREPGRRATNGRDARRNELVYFSPNHVAIAVGDGENVVTTDFGQAKPHIKTIASIEASYGPVVGVSSTFGGHPIPNIGAAPAAPTQPTGALVVDGVRGELTIKAEQRALGVSPDGKFGPVSIKAEQARVGVRADGIRGRETIKGVQRHVGAAVDGVEGPNTIKAEQRALNARTF